MDFDSFVDIESEPVTTGFHTEPQKFIDFIKKLPIRYFTEMSQSDFAALIKEEKRNVTLSKIGKNLFFFIKF